MTAKPANRPVNPCFSSGPCAKRPGWSLDNLSGAFLGRSHRAAPGKEKLKLVIEKHRALLGIPADYKIAIVPASDTGAIEMAMWSMLGQRGVDAVAWEVFGAEWLKDITTQLKLDDVRTFKAAFGELPDLAQIDTDRDVVFTWNGTTSGVCVPHADWIKPDRQGLTFCDATSAVFAYDMPWPLLDVTTWSWQKVLGGEAAHGMLVLSPRAVARLETYKPGRPLPKIFRMTSGGKLLNGLFEGETLNTPSMLAVEDCLDALSWVESIGGLKATRARSEDNFGALAEWVRVTPWVEFLPVDPAICSRTSPCLKITDPYVESLDDDGRAAFVKAMTKLLEKDGIAYDTAGHRDAPAGLRIWTGATVETSDIKALTPWLDWAFAAAKAEAQKQAA
ncbi:MAG: phosphoserine transaminase [Micavibrio aeruginosavorus]|uniref:phosphoserine transaminase n=1 Tax=Micavibrio aeruginosavorus TaxID=349221 RepID=A0A7T5UJ33_9BACT|nr:MAG: phosphoserine transaminase [Micavibrio aeruginosavorus]